MPVAPINHDYSPVPFHPSGCPTPVGTGLLSSAHVGRIKVDRCIVTTEDVKPSSLNHNTPLAYIGSSLKRALAPKNIVRSCPGFAQSLFPSINLLLNYQWRTDFFSDLSAGLTVGVMNVPQGMAYAMLADLPPVYGLYVSFIAPLLYAVMGRCSQLSLGTFAVVSLLLSQPVGRVCQKVFSEAVQNLTALEDKQIPICFTPEANEYPRGFSKDLFSKERLYDFRPVVIITLTFLVGIIQISFGVLRLGKLTSYLAPAMVDGFITGAGIHVFTSQISSLFGVKAAKNRGGIGSVFKVYYNLARHITSVNPVTVALSLSSILFLLVTKLWMEPFVQRTGHCSYPIPAELILVFAGTILSAIIELDDRYNVTVVGHIVEGMPSFTLPNWDLIPELLVDAVIIGFTSTFLTISLVKMFSLKHRTNINYDHELTCFGLITLSSSFLSGFVPSGSISRSMVLEGANVRTPLNGIATSLLIVFVLLFLGPQLSDTPTCILAAIIVVALLGILKRLREIPRLWRTCKRDFFLYCGTILSTVIFGVIVGLVVGVLSCLIVLTERQGHFDLRLMHNFPGTEIFFCDLPGSEENQPDRVGEIDALFKQIIPCKLTGALNFASAEKLPDKMEKLITLHTTSQRNSDEFETTSYRRNQTPTEQTISENYEMESVEGKKEMDLASGSQKQDVFDYVFTSQNGKIEGHLNSAAKDTSLDQERNNHRPQTIQTHESNERPRYRCGSCCPVGGTRSQGRGEDTTHMQTAQRDSTERLQAPKLFVLMDITGLSQVDPSGAKTLKEVHEELFRRGIFLLFVGDLRFFPCLKTSTWSQCLDLSFSYPTVQDAFVASYKCLYQRNHLRPSPDQTPPRCKVEKLYPMLS
ncbi:unnamed protein product [Calicophoron daubneyi]|uniref:STAS domain-containing protein n=1 Tax=Calicophoron daubneyi TaxID=300641 RepID=A0AAV2TJC9_CALDB